MVARDDGTAIDFDFDASWREHGAPPLRVRAFGKVYELPSSIPAKMHLFVLRIQEKESEEELSVPEVMGLLELCLGKENFDGLMDDGILVEQLEHLFANITRLYVARMPHPEEEATGEVDRGNVPDPAGKAG